MRNLPLPERDQVRDHLVVALEQHVYKGVAHGYAISAAELDGIVALYDQYDATHGSAQAALIGGQLEQELRQAIFSSYRFVREGMRLGHVRAMLATGIEMCPICGISYPGELDHYLPRSTFRALAIYVRNLIPHCHECNQRKSASASTQPNQRFIHAYFEPLPDVQFLVADVSTENGLDVEFSIAAVEGLSEQLHDRLVNQFDKLKLNERYGRELNAYMMSYAAALHMAFEYGAEYGVRTLLLRQAEIERAVLYRNHWRPVLLDALAHHDGFCGGAFAEVLPAVPVAA